MYIDIIIPVIIGHSIDVLDYRINGHSDLRESGVDLSDIYVWRMVIGETSGREFRMLNVRIQIMHYTHSRFDDNYSTSIIHITHTYNIWATIAVFMYLCRPGYRPISHWNIEIHGISNTWEFNRICRVSWGRSVIIFRNDVETEHMSV